MSEETSSFEEVLSHQGKVAIVTGAGRGIGRAIALELAREGAAVVVNDLGVSLQGTGSDDKVASDVVEEIVASGGRAISHAGNVADRSAVEEMVRMALEDLGGLDILVNVAGIMRKGTIFDASFEDWTKVIDVHLTGTFTTCRVAAPIMVERGWGRIINFTSHSAFGFEGQPAYAAAKAGIIGLTLATATELAGSNVTCNAVAPAATTRMSESSRPEFERMRKEGLIDEVVWNRYDSLPQPTNTSPVVSYLASQAAADITGLVFTAGFGVSAIKMVNETTMHAKENLDDPFELTELNTIIPSIVQEALDGDGLLGELP